MKKQRENRTDQGKKQMWITRMRVPVVLGCILVFGVSMAYAKYLQASRHNDAVTANEFYFSSDVLDGGVHEIPALETDGTATLVFHLMNHEDQLRYADVAIKYEVTCQESSETSGNTERADEDDSENAMIPANTKNGEIAAGADQDKQITISELQPGKTYEVTANAVSPYTKTLTGTIRVQELDSQIHASLDDKGNYIEVTVWAGDEAKNALTLECANSLIPDNTDTWMREMSTGTTVSFSLDPNASHVFRFFKSDAAKTYQVSVAGEKVTVSE